MAMLLPFGAAISAENAKKLNCDDPVENGELRISLRDSIQDGRGEFQGNFEIENLSKSQKVALSGKKEKSSFHVWYPDASHDSLDANGSWRPLQENTPGTFLAAPDKLVIEASTKARFVADLPRRSFASNGRAFRLVLFAAGGRRCFVSRPFEVLPKRPEIQGFAEENKQ